MDGQRRWLALPSRSSERLLFSASARLRPSVGLRCGSLRSALHSERRLVEYWTKLEPFLMRIPVSKLSPHPSPLWGRSFKRKCPLFAGTCIKKYGKSLFTAGQKGAQVIRKAKSRRSAFAGKPGLRKSAE